MRAERGARQGDEPVDVGLTGVQWSGPQRIGGGDALGEQRGDLVGLIGQCLGVGGRHRQRVDTDQLAHRVEARRSCAGSRGADSMVVCALRNAATAASAR